MVQTGLTVYFYMLEMIISLLWNIRVNMAFPKLFLDFVVLYKAGYKTDSLDR